MPIANPYCGRSGLLASACVMLGAIAGQPALAQQSTGTLFVTASTYAGNAQTVQVNQPLPTNPTVKAIANGSYPTVFANDTVDANFGITAPIELIAAPVTINASGGTFSGPQTRIDVTQQTKIVTSFSSKSEMGIQLSNDGSALTFTGYDALINVLDVSNTNTAMHDDMTNTDIQSDTPRTVIQFNLATGTFVTTDTEAYSGNNMRAAFLAANVNGSGVNEYLLAGNAGNGGSPEPTYIVNDTGVQVVTAATAPVTTVVGVQQGTPGSKNGFQYGFSVANPPLNYPADKSGKDDNFRGETVFNNTLYVTKGSGGNGINTVYQVLPNNTAGLLPTMATGPMTTISILPGFPTNLAANIVKGDPATAFYPFGLWFANATTLYVADEGSQDLTADANAGLQKWIFNGTKWVLAYTIQAGLNLDQPYSVPGYPSSYNPANTGLRHITGVISGNSVIIYASTATYSALGDPGADPNSVVEVVDQLNATTLPPGAAFTTVVKPYARQVYRGVRFTTSAFKP